MTFSKTSHNLVVLAILLATIFFAHSSICGEKLCKSTSAPINHSRAVVILLADGGAPMPIPPPPPPHFRSSARPA